MYTYTVNVSTSTEPFAERSFTQRYTAPRGIQICKQNKCTRFVGVETWNRGGSADINEYLAVKQSSGMPASEGAGAGGIL